MHSTVHCYNFAEVLDYMNFIDSSKKIQLTTSCPTNNALEFLDLTLFSDAISKQILVDVFSKSMNSFTYVMLSIYFCRRNIEMVPESVACDTDRKFKIRSNEYQKCLIARGYNLHKVSKQFSDVAKISREIARQPRIKMDFKVTSFLTEYNPLLPNLKKLIRNRLPLLCSDPKMIIIIIIIIINLF